MLNSKFITLYRTLTAEEASAFYRYLKQQHGNKAAFEVFEYIRKFYPEFKEEKKLDMAYAYQIIFNKTLSTQDESRKNRLNDLHELREWLKDFLLFEKIRKNSLERKVLWLSILQERESLKSEFSKEAAQFYAKTNQNLLEDPHGGLREIVANYFYYQEHLRTKPRPDTKVLQQCIDTLETWAEIFRLKMSCQMANIAQMQPPMDEDMGEASTDPAVPAETPTAEPPALLLVYRAIHQLFETKDDTSYNHVESVLVKHATQLDPVELHGALKYLYNYAAIQIRNGREEFFSKKLHYLNQISLQYGFFTEKGVMTARTFANMVNVACAAQDVSWASAFIKEQNHLLPDDLREATVKLSTAIIAFEKKEFKTVLSLLNGLEFDDLHVTIRLRALLLKTFYETEADFERTFNYSASFESLLRRNQNPKTDPVEATLAFVLIFKMLLMQKTSKPTLMKRINESTNLYFRTWLSKKANDYQQI